MLVARNRRVMLLQIMVVTHHLTDTELSFRPSEHVDRHTAARTERNGVDDSL